MPLKKAPIVMRQGVARFVVPKNPMNKKSHRSFLAALVLVFAVLSPVARGRCASDAPVAGEVKLLTIGNSFADDSTFFLPQFAKADGKMLVVFSANLGGHSLEQHVGYLKAFEADSADPKGSPYKNKTDPQTGKKRDFSLRGALESAPWDYVTIQQVSTKSFKPETFEPYAGILVDYIHKYAPTAKVLVLQTWAYRQDHPLLAQEHLTQQSMFEGLRSAYAQLAKRYGLQILPVGEAMQAARALPRWTFSPDPNFDYANPKPGTLPLETGSLNRGWSWSKDAASGKASFVLDAKHCNPAGRFLAASVLYEFLFSKVRDNPFLPPDLTAEDAAELRRIAQEAVAANAGSAKAAATPAP